VIESEHAKNDAKIHFGFTRRAFIFNEETTSNVLASEYERK